MKKKFIKKFLVRTILSLLCVLIILSTIFYFHTKNKWKSFLSESEIEQVIEEINDAEQIPIKFLDIHKKTNPKKLERTLNEFIISAILFKSENNATPISLDVTERLSPKRETNSVITTFQYFASLTWQIENRTSSENCLNWYLSKYDFVYNQIGLKNASKFYFQKPLNQLNDNEVFGLIAMLENPLLYNPKRNKDIYEKRVDKLIITAHNNGYK